MKTIEAAALGGSLRARLTLEEGPECPLNLAWLWEDYLDLMKGRSPGFGAAALTWPVLETWMRLRNRPLDQREIDVIFDLETVQPEGVEFDG